MSYPSFRIRFLGRFVFACLKDVADPKRLDALAMNMAFNADLHGHPHRTLITIPRCQFSPRVSSFADFSTVAPTLNPTETGELFTWDAGGCDVTFEGFDPKNPLSFDGWGDMPDLEEKYGGKNPLKSEFVLGQVTGRSPVAGRVRIPPGAVRAIPFRPEKRVSFEEMEKLTPSEPGPFRVLPDIVDVDLPGATRTTPLEITLTPYHDGGQRSIVVSPPPVADGDPSLVIITNLCAARVPLDSEDREFATYYDVLTTPPVSRKRKIPFTRVGPSEGGRIDCTGVAKAVYFG